MNLIEKRMKIQNLFWFWSQSFPNCFDLQLKNGLAPVLKAGSSGIRFGRVYLNKWFIPTIYLSSWIISALLLACFYKEVMLISRPGFETGPRPQPIWAEPSRPEIRPGLGLAEAQPPAGPRSLKKNWNLAVSTVFRYFGPSNVLNQDYLRHFLWI